MEFDVVKYRDIVQSSFTRIVEHPWPLEVLRRASFQKNKIDKKLQVTRSYLYLRRHHPEIVAAQLAARKDGGLSGDYQWLRLKELADLVAEFKPQSICELGCGTSSLLFAKLMGSKERFATCEESLYWLDRMLATAGPLATQIDAVHASRVLENRDGESVTYYSIDHKQNYDFVYVDGPTSFKLETDPEVRSKDPDGMMANGDVELFWENGVYPKLIVIDGRRPTVRRLIERNPGNYKVYLKSDLLQRSGIVDFSRHRYHTLFVRTNG